MRVVSCFGKRHHGAWWSATARILELPKSAGFETMSGVADGGATGQARSAEPREHERRGLETPIGVEQGRTTLGLRQRAAGGRQMPSPAKVQL